MTMKAPKTFQNSLKVKAFLPTRKQSKASCGKNSRSSHSLKNLNYPLEVERMFQSKEEAQQAGVGVVS